MSNNYIYIGSTSAPSHFFDNESLLSVHADVATAMIEDELKIDTLEFEVSYNDADETLRNLAYATPIYYYNGPNFMGTFYFKTVERYGDHYYRVSAVSIIGILEYETFYGGYYVAKNVKDLIISTFLTDALTDDVYIGFSSARSVPQPNVYIENYLMNANGYTRSGVTTSDVFLFDFKINSISEETDLYRIEKYDASLQTDSVVFSISVIPASGTRFEDLGDYALYFQMINRRDSTHIYSSYQYFGANYEDLVHLHIQLSNSGSPVLYSINDGEITHPIYDEDMGDHGDHGDAQGKIFADGILLPVETINGVYASSSGYTLSNAEGLGYELIGLRWWSIALQRNLFQVVPVYNALTNKLCFIETVTKYAVETNDYVPSGEIVSYDDISTVTPTLAKQIMGIIWTDNADNLTVSGYLPISSRREALHKILFALNLNMIKTEDGNLIIGKLVDQVYSEIDSERIYDAGSVQKVKAPLELALTEYAYSPDTVTTVELFDNTNENVGSGQYVVTFSSAPIYGAPTATSGMRIYQYNSNAAIVSGKGKITGKVYRESRRDVTRKISDRADGGRVSVSSVQLVTALNASSVMDKLLAYYGGNVYKIKNSIIANGERTGNKYAFNTPFGDRVEAFLNSYVLHNSSFVKLDCEFTAGFVPQDVGSQYNNYVVLTGSGTWEVPSSVFQKTNPRIYVVMIGGGQGGASGYAGEDGKTNSSLSTRSVAHGGMYGENGTSGKVFTHEINNPSASYSYSCGAGGVGGAVCSNTKNNNKGINGTATIFDSFSSDSGVNLENGYTNLLNGEVYAGMMIQWNADSGKGGDGEYVTVGSEHTYESITRYAASTIYDFMTGRTLRSRAIGQDGAWGSINAGSNGRSISQLGGGAGGSALDEYGGWHGTIIDTAGLERDLIGGAGATPTYVPPKATTYNPHYFGYGGMGGPGGGGGGNGGAYEDRWSDTSPHVYSYPGGTGGKGGKGGDGGDGCVLIYY